MSETKQSFLQANRELIVVIGLVFACLVIYGQTVGFQFINFDDNLYVYENKEVLKGLNWETARWALTAFHAANWHPLTWLSHAADVQMFGTNAGAHHATNIVLHIINSILAFIVFRRMTGSFWKSALVAAVLAVHPTHVESVAWVAERKDVLSTMFWLLTMLAYFKYIRAESDGNETRGTNYYLLAILLFALGLLAKPMLVTLPFALLLCDYWGLERLKTAKDLVSLVKEKLPFFFLAAISCVITIFAQRAGGAVQTLENLPIFVRAVNAIMSYARYSVMLFYPAKMSVWYPYDFEFDWLKFIGSLVLVVGVSVFCWRQRRVRKYLLMGWLWFLGTLVPVIGLVQVGAQPLADRYTYIPYLGLSAMVVWAAGDVFERLKIKREITAAIAVVCIAALLVAARRQTSYWQNNETLFRHSLAVTERNHVISHNLCNDLSRQNRLDEAEEFCKQAISYYPNHIEALNTLGTIQAKKAEYAEAVASFDRVIELNPNHAYAHTNRAIALAKLGRFDEALASLERGVELDTDHDFTDEFVAGGYMTIGNGFAQTNQPDKAVAALQKAARLRPDQTDIKANLGLAEYMSGNLDEAEKILAEILRRDQNQPEVHNTLGSIYLGKNKRAEAIAEFEKALQIKPDYEAAKRNLQKAKGEK